MTDQAKQAAPTPTPEAASASADQLQLVTFEVAGEEFAVDILLVREINRMLELTRVPQSPPEVEGVVNLRGQIIPVVDMRKWFKLDAGERNDHNRIIVVDIDGRVIGFIVDRVHEVLRISPSIVDNAPTFDGSVDREYVSGVGKLEDRLLLMLDVRKIFGASEGVVADYQGAAAPKPNAAAAAA